MNLSKKALETKGSSTLKITSKAKELINNGVDVIAFTAGEPDFQTPENIKKAGIKAINDGKTTYTATEGIIELRKAICEKLKNDNNLDYDYSEIVVSNGAKHSLMNAFFALLDENDEVLIPVPYWLSYKSMVELAGGVPIFVNTEKENDYKPTVEDLEKALTPKSKILLLNSPSNPTGAVYTYDEVKSYADFAKKHDLIVISDEIYELLIYDDDFKHISIASLPDMKDRTIVINGFSKSYAMTGWRLGYLACPKDVATAITNIQSHMTSNPSSITQYSALEALHGTNENVTEMKKSFKLRRDYIYENVTKINGLSAVYPVGAFYLYVDIENIIGKKHNDKVIMTCDDVAEILINDFSVCVIPCTDFGSTSHIRMSYAIELDKIKEGVKRLENFVNSLK